MRKRIKVLHLGYEYIDRYYSLQHECAKAYDLSDDFEVTEVYLFGEAPAGHLNLQSGKLVCYNFSKSQIRLIPFKPLKKLLKLCREREFDVLVCHRYKPAYVAGWLSKFYKFKKIITVFHGLGEFRRLSRGIFFKYFLPDAIKAGVSEAVRKDILENVPGAGDNDTITLYNAMDLEALRRNYRSRDAARAELGLPTDKFVFGSIGRLVAKKGYKNLIDAVSNLERDDFCVAIIGDGNYRGELERQIKRKNLEGRVLLCGWSDEAASYVKAFDTFILPSLSEGFGLVFIEAMAAGVPCIGTDSGGVREVLAEAGVVIPCDDVDAIEKALIDDLAKSDQEREEARQCHLQRVEMFSIDKLRAMYCKAAYLD